MALTWSSDTLEHILKLAHYHWIYQHGVVHNKEEDYLRQSERVYIKLWMILHKQLSPKGLLQEDCYLVIFFGITCGACQVI